MILVIQTKHAVMQLQVRIESKALFFYLKFFTILIISFQNGFAVVSLFKNHWNIHSLFSMIHNYLQVVLVTLKIAHSAVLHKTRMIPLIGHGTMVKQSLALQDPVVTTLKAPLQVWTRSRSLFLWFYLFFYLMKDMTLIIIIRNCISWITNNHVPIFIQT